MYNIKTSHIGRKPLLTSGMMARTFLATCLVLPTLAIASNLDIQNQGKVVASNTPSELPRHLSQVKETGHMTLLVRQGNLLRLPRPAAKVLVADPKVASFQVPSSTSLFVYAESVGKTTLYALDNDDTVIAAIGIVAEHDLDTLVRQIKQEVQGADIQIEPSINNGLIIRGKVKTPLQASQVIASAQAYLDATAASSGSSSQNKIVNQLKVEMSSQVNIQVRVVEMSRTMSNELGFDWTAVLSSSGSLAGAATSGFNSMFQAGGNITKTIASGSPSFLNGAVSTGGIAIGGIRQRGRLGMGALLSAMQSEGMATILAEPNLTAMSGQTAAFAAGGEVPILLITNNNITIDYKAYGVILRMTPTILSANRISLHIAPEVSELTSEGSVQIPGGSNVPALRVRRADTTVELASGQSFALAGMLRSERGQVVQGIPGLRNLPMLGRMFETQKTQHSETELVILATAYVVDPVSPSQLQIPGQNLSHIQSLLPTQAAPGYLY